MNPRIQKEYRILLPYWAAALGCLSLVAIDWRQWGIWDRIGTAVGLQYMIFTLMGAMLFGVEYGERTMERLLSQSVPRIAIWREKRNVLAAMMFGCLVLDGVIIGFKVGYRFDLGDFWDMLLLPGGFLIILSTGPLMSFLSRQTHTAFWASLIFPFAVFLLAAWFVQLFVMGLDPKFSEHFVKMLGPFAEPLPFAAFIVPWSGICYYLGRRKFLKLEV